MKKFLLPFFFCCLFLCSAQSEQKYTQQEIDSFIIKELRYDNIKVLGKMLHSNENLLGYSSYYSMLGFKYFGNKQNDSAEYFAKKSIDIFYKNDIDNAIEEESLLSNYYTLGRIYREKDEFAESTNYILKGLEIEKKYPYKYKSYLRATIANNHMSLGNNEKALAYYHINLKDTIYTALAQPYVATLNKVGRLYTKRYLNKQDSALFYFNKALEVSIKNKYKSNLPFIYYQLGFLYKNQMPDSVLSYFKKSQKAFKSYQMEKNVSPSNVELQQRVVNSYVDIYDEKYKLAIRNLKKVIDSLNPTVNNKNDRDILVDAYDYIVMANEKTKNFSGANIFLKEKNKFENKFHQKELEKELERLELTYETTKKKEQIKQLSKEAETTSQLVRQQRILLGAGVGVLLLSTIIAALFYRQNKLHTKLEKVFMEQRLLRSQMNPHFLFNSMQQASVLIDKNAEAAKNYISNLGRLLRLTLENSRQDFVYLKDELEALDKYLILESGFSKKFDYTITVANELDTELLKVPPMLIQPVVENAIKHGIQQSNERGEIKIILSKHAPDILYCQVQDNGPGFQGSSEKFTKHKSLSLTILNERLAAFNKKKYSLRVATDRTKSNPLTKVYMYLPVIKI